MSAANDVSFRERAPTRQAARREARGARSTGAVTRTNGSFPSVPSDHATTHSQRPSGAHPTSHQLHHQRRPPEPPRRQPPPGQRVVVLPEPIPLHRPDERRHDPVRLAAIPQLAQGRYQEPRRVDPRRPAPRPPTVKPSPERGLAPRDRRDPERRREPARVEQPLLHEPAPHVLP